VTPISRWEFAALSIPGCSLSGIIESINSFLDASTALDQREQVKQIGAHQ
jgi:hypothetical protein